MSEPAAILAPAEVAFAVRGNPVSQNRAWRIITLRRRGGPGHASLKLSADGEAWKQLVSYTALAARPRGWRLDHEQYEVELVWHFDSRRPDVDGPCKLTLDALAGVLFENDRQVWRVVQTKEVDRASPRAIVRVRPRQRNP